MNSTPKHTFSASAIVFAMAAAGFATAADAAAVLDRSAAKITRAEGGRALSTPSAAPAADIVARYLRSRGRGEAVIASLRAKSEGPGANGVRHVRMEQVVDGLVVHGAYLKAAVNSRGELVQVIDRLAATSTPVPSQVDARAALQAAMLRLYPAQATTFSKTGQDGNSTTFDGGAFFHSDPVVTAVAVPLSDGSLARGWLVETWTQRRNQLHYTLVGGDGAVVDVESRTQSDSYNVFVEDPLKGPQAIVNGPAPGGVASPSGWLGTGRQKTAHIVGNNVRSYLDVDSNNRVDRAGTYVRNGNFLTAVDLTQSPTATGNRAVAVQNLFYLNNTVHDILYGHGFDEVAGNFQIDNFGRGGSGNDPVNAEAQDGGGLDNANFATPVDGRKPRMQMYVWNGAGPTHEVKVNSPVSKSYAAKGAQFGPTLTTSGVTGAVVTTTPTDGCAAISTALAGKVALIDRGNCAFTVKVKNAQLAGASGAIIANNDATAIFLMGGTDATVTIPSVMISQADGVDLKGIAAPNATERLLAVQPLQIDGSIDADVVFHEYGHGLSWRMIGGMSGPIAGAIGEGNSDGIAMLINGDDKIGEYAASTPNGIRRFPYAGYPLTYANVTGAEVHNDGEPYAAIVWRMIELFGDTGRAKLFGYVVDGMNFTPSTPAYENMRDGILQSVANGPTPADCDLVWQAFSQFGVGPNAKGVVAGAAVTITPDFAMPAAGTCTLP